MEIEPVQSQTVRGRSEDAPLMPLVQAAEVAREYLRKTAPGKLSQPMAVFAELAERTAERATLGLGCEFTAQNLKAGVAPDAQKEPSGWLSPVWAKAVDREPQWQEGLVEIARQLGYSYTPKLTKAAGSPALYSLTAIPLPASVAQEPLTELAPGGIRYTPGVVSAPAAWLSATLRTGVLRWTPGVRWLVVGVFIVSLVIVALFVWGSFNEGIRRTRPLSASDVWSAVAIVLAIAAMIRFTRFFDELFDMGIVMTPSLLTPISEENVTLELRRRSADDTIGELAFVRYSGICSQCAAPVAIFLGGREFVGRLIGRCKRSPREHVYSFDHAIRAGRPLREPSARSPWATSRSIQEGGGS